MKHRLTVLLASACFSLSLLFNINSIVPLLNASADNVETVTLTAAETLALFGEHIMFTDPNSSSGGNFYTDTFDYVTVGLVELCPYLGNRQYINGEMVSASTTDIAGSGCLIYRTSYNGWTQNLSSANEVSVVLNTFANVENVDYFHFNLGFSSNEDYYRTNISNNYQAIMNSKGTFSLSNNTVVDCPLTFSQGSTYGNMSNCYITYVPSINSSAGFLGTNFQMNLTLENNVIVNNITASQCNRVARPRIGNPSGENDYTYLYITFPTLSDSWTSGGGGDDSSDSGDDSGGGIIVIPDYSEDIATIIEQLDTIISHEVDHFAQINSQMMALVSRFDGANSRLDQVNSNLNKIDSHIQQIHGADLSSLYYPSNGDNSRYQSAEHQLQSEMQAAMGDHAYLDSVRDFAGQSLPDLQNRNQLDSSFDNLWYYEDSDGFKWQNMMLFSMPVVTLMIGIISYIIFGKKG